MSRVRIDVDDILRSALTTYAAEVDEILDSIHLEAAVAGLDPQRFYPRDAADEMEAVEIAQRAVELFSDEHNPALRLMGTNVPDASCGVLVSALRLKQDELKTRLGLRQADPLAPAEAALVLGAQIAAIDERLRTATWARSGPSPLLERVRERRAIKQELAFPARLELTAVLQDGEGQELEFMVRFPDQAHELAKEVAAFGSSNPGTIVLGVSDDGSIIVGLSGVNTVTDRDRLQTRVEGVCANSVSPPLIPRTTFEEHDGKQVLRIEVPKGPEPVYFSNDRPYVRHGSLSRPARPQEVTELTRRWLARQRDYVER
jgi:Putative DNA-binding domain